MKSALAEAVSSVKWEAVVADFCGNTAIVARVESCNVRLALWARQFEIVCKGNAAVSFTREMQFCGHNVAALIALALYKPAAASMRSVAESALYFTYFVSHQSEMMTLVRDPQYYVDKASILAFHKIHTPQFTDCQSAVGLVSRMNEWYSAMSAIIHGQIPGEWSSSASLAETAHDSRTLEAAVTQFEVGEQIVNDLLLCTVGRANWDFFVPAAKKRFLHGHSKATRTLLKVDGG